MDNVVRTSERLVMEGSVSWTAEGWDSGYGKVVICKQDDTRLNVVFTCDGVGEGQITLAITTVEQFASARFRYNHVLTPTYAGVVGRLSWQAGSLQFEGRWDDQDSDTVWSFTIEIEGFGFAAGTTDSGDAPDPEMKSLDEILQTLDQRYLTDWFDPKVTPAMPGVYRVEKDHRVNGHLVFAAWDGASWSGARARVGDLANMVAHDHEAHSGRRWRGLTEEGAQRVSLLLSGVRRRENLDLLGCLREEESALARARAEALAVYQQVVAQIEGSDQAAPARKALRSALDQLVRADFDAPAEAVFDETMVGTVEDMHAQLPAAREQSAKRAGYWRTYWTNFWAKHTAFGLDLTSNGLVVRYGKDMQARLGKNDSMQPLPGSYGTKKRK
jgi:hypothetical protein